MGAAGIPIIGGMFSAAAIDDETTATAEALLREQRALEKNAEIAREAGQFNAARQQDESNLVFGTMRADVGASGTEANSGSVLELLRQSHANAELDRQVILHEAELQAIDYENQARGTAANIQSVFRMGESRKLAALLGGLAQGVSNLPANDSAAEGSRPRLRQTSDSGGSSRRSVGGGRYMIGEAY